MEQLNSHNLSLRPRPTLPIIQHFVGAYRIWHEFLPNLSKESRYTLGSKVDALFIDTIEAVHAASYAPRDKKLVHIQSASAKLDTLKFFLQVSWEVKALDTKKYASLSEMLDEIGRMLGGWLKQAEKQETPPQRRG